MSIKLQARGPATWEVPREGAMRVPARIYATEKMLDKIRQDKALEQAVNVAHLPGIVRYSLAMPDIHWGYGFPIGGVAAIDPGDGVISPGGVGYDINCGVRLMASKLSRDRIIPDGDGSLSRLHRLVASLYNRVPTGVGARSGVSVTESDLRRILRQGAPWAVKNGHGTESDLEYIEEQGCVEDADDAAVSDRALERGRPQIGTLGSGNHFLEVGYVAEIYDASAAAAMGLERDQVTVIIHCGSRGFGYQVCDDYLKVMQRAVAKYGIRIPDRQLCCAPIDSEEGRQYIRAMNCAINYAFANREVIADQVRRAFVEALGISDREAGLRTIYEVAHNIAKMETHNVNGEKKRLCIHRKGATRAFGPGHPEIPAAYKGIGQPVLIPGDMGRYSYVLVGTEKAMTDTFGSTCHGAGREMSRHAARKLAKGRRIAAELERSGIIVMASSRRTIDEELSEAYKDVRDVVDACQAAGISRTVAQLRPLGCIKG